MMQIEAIDEWRQEVLRALQLEETPFYLFREAAIVRQFDVFSKASFCAPIRNWLSVKTCPLPRLVHSWLRLGGGVEVVSGYELELCLRGGARPESVLVNGLAKADWLGKYMLEGLCVTFDSLREVSSLAPLAGRLNWRVGLRLNLRSERDPDEPEYGTQFGLSADEATSALEMLNSVNIRPDLVHFHLRSNVPSFQDYLCGVMEAADFCSQAGFQPRILDCGGGFPVPGEWTPSGAPTAEHFEIGDLGSFVSSAVAEIPSVEEVWFENGRFIVAGAAVLVIRVADRKKRDDSIFLICDGGRVVNALVSDWERHLLVPLRHTSGPERLTTVCGPTCMAFDRLCRIPLDESIEVGDHLIWCNAGAYHLPWETRFSQGTAAILWTNVSGAIESIRSHQTFESWYRSWGCSE